jgi:feruloyl esterase
MILLNNRRRNLLCRADYVATDKGGQSMLRTRAGLSKGASRSLLLIATVLGTAGLVNVGHAAATQASLGVIRPITSCPELAKTDLDRIADAPGKVVSAELTDTPKGPFCRIVAQFEPFIVATINLPTQHWTQRFVMSGGGGGAPGPNGYRQAGTCAPALNGEFAVSGNNLGRFGQATRDDTFTAKFWEVAGSPQRRIDWAYRADHVTVLASKVLIKAYYGRAARYSYFIGCSGGGREALVEAQRYPEDFDGVSAGAPAALETAEETTFHLWIIQANRRADGTNILMPAKRKLVHDAVVEHCDTLSGIKDGLLEDPRACDFNPASLQCASGADTAGCLTAEEVTVLRKLYDGAADDQGHHFLFGLERGGEVFWNLANTPTAEPPAARMAAMQRAYAMLPDITPTLADFNQSTDFTQGNFELGSALSPLYDALNTDLGPFAARGGKLILWHGLADFMIPPRMTLAYYQGVRHFMGTAASDRFLRLFLLPGVGHCGGGDGLDQIDTLSALMAWTELKRPPTQIMTGRGASADASAVVNSGLPRPSAPYATPMPTLVATRPVYPYPYVAHYAGAGDPKDGGNFAPVNGPMEPAPAFDYEALKLIGPDNQHDYAVKNGRLTVATP